MFGETLHSVVHLRKHCSSYPCFISIVLRTKCYSQSDEVTHGNFPGAQYALEGMLVYPNKMDFPVMENFGKPPVPLGMLEVVIKSAEGLPNADFMGTSDPFVEVRKLEIFTARHRGLQL